MNKETKEAAFPLWEAVCYKTGQPPYEIVFEDEKLLVCKKAPGLPVQSAALRVKDLETMLKNLLAAKATTKSAGKVPYLGVVHRLDQPVQGLVVFAKTPKAAVHLSQQVQSRDMKKEYLAVCDGIPLQEKGTLKDWLVKDGKTNTSKVVSQQTREAKEAHLEYELLQATADKSLVKIQLHTGRHHQIRVQLSNAGFPIVGDQKYNVSERAKKPAGPVSLGGCKGVLKLCAARLEFVHPKTEKQMVFSLYE